MEGSYRTTEEAVWLSLAFMLSYHSDCVSSMSMLAVALKNGVYMLILNPAFVQCCSCRASTTIKVHELLFWPPDFSLWEFKSQLTGCSSKVFFPHYKHKIRLSSAREPACSLDRTHSRARRHSQSKLVACQAENWQTGKSQIISSLLDMQMPLGSLRPGLPTMVDDDQTLGLRSRLGHIFPQLPVPAMLPDPVKSTL